MQLSFNFEGKTNAATAEALRSLANLLDGPKEEVKTETKGKPAKAKPAEDDTEEFDLGDGSEETEPSCEASETDEDAPEVEEEPEEKPAPKAAKIKLDDVIEAFRTYVQKNKKPEAKSLAMKKAQEILSKFKVKDVHRLKPEQYASVMKAIGA